MSNKILDLTGAAGGDIVPPEYVEAYILKYALCQSCKQTALMTDIVMFDSEDDLIKRATNEHAAFGTKPNSKFCFTPQLMIGYDMAFVDSKLLTK